MRTATIGRSVSRLTGEKGIPASTPIATEWYTFCPHLYSQRYLPDSILFILVTSARCTSCRARSSGELPCIRSSRSARLLYIPLMFHCMRSFVRLVVDVLLSLVLVVSDTGLDDASGLFCVVNTLDVVGQFLTVCPWRIE